MSTFADRRRPTIRGAFRRAFHTLSVGALTLLIGVTLLATGDRIETWAAPIVRDGRVDNISRAGGVVCWDLTYDKRRDVAPLSFVTTLFTPDLPDRYTLLPWPAELGTEHRGQIIVRPVGITTRRLCVWLPRSGASIRSGTIATLATYDVGPRPWATLVRLPDVRF